MEILILLWIVGASAYAGNKADEYFTKKGGVLTLVVLVVNFIFMPMIVALKQFELLPNNDWF